MRPSQSYMESIFSERKKAAYMQGDEEEMPGMKH
jgi:hypothetical protein